jgi:Protein of unknown function (DUF3738)
MKPIMKSLLIVLAVAGFASAQSQSEFEVAALKPSTMRSDASSNISLGNGFVMLRNAALSECVQFAYGIVSDALITGPEWIKSKDVRFDIAAHVPRGTPQDQIRVIHHQAKTSPGTLLHSSVPRIQNHQHPVIRIASRYSKPSPTSQAYLYGDGTRPIFPGTRLHIEAAL